MEGLAIIGCFIIPAVTAIIIVWLTLNAKNKRYQLKADLVAKALEKGQPIPADLFIEPKKVRSKLSSWFIGLAVGIVIAWLLTKGDGSGNEQNDFLALSLFFVSLFISIAYVIIHFIEKRKASNENAK